MDVGDRIRRIREERGLSQRRLAQLAGIGQSFLSQVERGEKDPGIKTLLNICKALNVSIAHLFEDGGDLPPHIRSLIREARSLSPEQAEQLAKFIRTMKGRQ